MKQVVALTVSLSAFFVSAPCHAATAPATFDPAQARPYFSGDADPTVKEALRAFRTERWADAANGFAAFIRNGKHPKKSDPDPNGDRLRAGFLEAFSLSKAGRFVEAAALFDDLAKRDPLLADYDHLYAARALLGAKRFENALERARLVEKGSVLDAEARYARGDALANLSRAAEAEREFRGYIETYPTGWREAEALFRLAQLVAEPRAERAQKPQRTDEARDLYRRIYIRFPTHTLAAQAEAQLRKMQASDGKALALSGPEQLERGLALFEQMRNAESEAAFRVALSSGGLDVAQTCVASFNLAQSVFKARDRPRAAALFDAAAEACEKAPKEDAACADLHAKSLYQGGRCHAAKDEPDRALHAYARLEAEHKAHSYADDARLRSAEIVHGMLELLRSEKSAPGETQRARIALLIEAPSPTASDEAIKLLAAREETLLSSIVSAYPGGDQGGEALFRLAFHALQAGDSDGARRWLDEELATFPHEDGWWEAGRTLYWLGRLDEKQGKRDQAVQRFSRCATEYPLSYYALASLNRLREATPELEKKLVADLEKPVATPADLAWNFAPNPIFSSLAWQRGLVLARLGLGAEARREIAAAGIKVPEHRGTKLAPGDGPGEELLWVASVLYDAACEWALSHFIPRHILTAYQSRWPVSDNRKRWLLSYPRGYADLIVDNAAKNGQPAALEFAIVREESAFDPSDESFANAVGLTQLTQAPAKRFALGLPYTREALKDPVINVTIGARELGDLWKRTGGMAALAIAGYNAGDGAVRRWLRAAPAGEPLDEFIERIPFDETRGYTKRVLGSWFAYHWLYDQSGDPVPPLPQKLPSSL